MATQAKSFYGSKLRKRVKSEVETKRNDVISSETSQVAEDFKDIVHLDGYNSKVRIVKENEQVSNFLLPE